MSEGICAKHKTTSHHSQYETESIPCQSGTKAKRERNCLDHVPKHRSPGDIHDGTETENEAVALLSQCQTLRVKTYGFMGGDQAGSLSVITEIAHCL